MTTTLRQAQSRRDAALRKEQRLWNDGKPRKGWEDAARELERAARVLFQVVDALRPKKEIKVDEPILRGGRLSPRKNEGVPDEFLKFPGGPFKAGYDAKYKSLLVKCALGKSKRFSRREAEERLRVRGWLHHLDKARR